MGQRAWVRMGAVSGLVYVILLIAGFVIGVASAPTPPSVFGTPEQVGAQIAQVTSFIARSGEALTPEELARFPDEDVDAAKVDSIFTLCGLPDRLD